jgi:hypothetical protein
MFQVCNFTNFNLLYNRLEIRPTNIVTKCKRTYIYTSVKIGSI